MTRTSLIVAIVLAGTTGSPVANTQPSAALPPAGMWVATAAMSTARYAHTATRLPDGRVLVAGGISGDGASGDHAVASAEIYDPALRTWSSTDPMSTARGHATATLLPDGRVLVTGGHDRDYIGLASAEIYDPARGTWSLTGTMSRPRYAHTATLLADGRLLVAGGFVYRYEGYENSTAEIYDPARGTWSVTGDMSQSRASHTGTLLTDGRVIVTGGTAWQYFYYDDSWYWYDFGPIASVEIYDPAAGTWSVAADMPAPREEHTATLLRDGRLLVDSAAIYDPGRQTWSVTSPMSRVRSLHTSTSLSDGRVLVAGGDTASAETYDPALDTWSGTNYMSTSRSRHTATLLASGEVLVAGGQLSNQLVPNLASAEIYDPHATPPADASAPQVSCGTADGAWHNYDVSVTCLANDPESGLANEFNSVFTLLTNVPVGTESSNAATNSRLVCNTQGGCTSAGPITGHRVDKKPPTITIVAPVAGARYQVGASVTASYNCAATGAEVAMCYGQDSTTATSVPDRSLLNTSSTGQKNLYVTAIDFAGNTSTLYAFYTVVVAGSGGLTPEADVGVALSAPVRIQSGRTMTYAMTVTNTQTGSAAGVLVANTLPVGTVFASASTSQGTLTAPSVGSNGTVSVTLGSLAPGATARVNVVVTVTAKRFTMLTDRATVTATTPDSNSSNNSATANTTVK